MSTHCLLLNASFEPLHIVTWQKAIQLLFQGKVVVLEESDWKVNSIQISIRVPAVMRLSKYVSLHGKQTMIRFSRINVFLRDRYSCQYCGSSHPKSQLTLDHVIPVVQGGKKQWENIVTSCRKCNQKKGGRTPREAKMNLLSPPIVPTYLPDQIHRLESQQMPERWKQYLKT